MMESPLPQHNFTTDRGVDAADRIRGILQTAYYSGVKLSESTVFEYDGILIEVVPDDTYRYLYRELEHRSS